MQIRRLPDWHPRLSAWLTGCARHPLVPGEHDCALFAAGAVQAMTGSDPAARWRGGYTSLPQGLRALRAAGFADHVAVVAALFEEVPPAFAQVGDIAVVRQPGELPALGVVTGAEVAVLREAGLGFVSCLDAAQAWRVP